ncbi:hypothetical protein SRHO_G00234160 [Serrasalmus rhombeus]
MKLTKVHAAVCIDAGLEEVAVNAATFFRASQKKQRHEERARERGQAEVTERMSVERRGIKGNFRIGSKVVLTRMMANEGTLSLLWFLTRLDCVPARQHDSLTACWCEWDRNELRGRSVLSAACLSFCFRREQQTQLQLSERSTAARVTFNTANHGSRSGQRKDSSKGQKGQSSDIVYVVGGWSKDSPSCPVQQFCSQYNEWKMTTPMLRHRGDAGVCVCVCVCAMGGFIYTVGGADDLTCVSSVERYDPEYNSWCADVAPLSSPRSRVYVVEMDGCLIALGGYDGTTCTNAVERYDPVRNSWCKLAPMLRRRAGAAAAVLEGLIYVVGGTDGDAPLDTVERFSPVDGGWSLCPPMLSVREGGGCCVYSGCLYVAGGRDELGLALSTVEKYDPHTGCWSPEEPEIPVFNGLLLAIGGSDGVSDLKTTEAYDHEANSWRHFGSMKSKHPGGHVAVVKAFC